MNKSELVKDVASCCAHSQAVVHEVITTLTNCIMDELNDGGKVSLTGFGTFKVAHRKGYMGRNPQTGEPMKIAAKDSPKFVAGSTFKDSVA